MSQSERGESILEDVLRLAEIHGEIGDLRSAHQAKMENLYVEAKKRIANLRKLGVAGEFFVIPDDISDAELPPSSRRG